MKIKKNNNVAHNYGIVTIPGLSEWDEKELGFIASLEQEYRFKKFYLTGKLHEIFEKIHSLSYLVRSNPSEKEQIEYIQEIHIHLKALLELLSPERMGRIIENRFADKVLPAKYIFQVFNKLCNFMCGVCINSQVKIKKFSIDKKTDTQIRKLPKNSDKRNVKRFKMTILSYLKEVFEEGSSLPATTYVSQYSNDGYDGNLYRFITDLKCLIEKKLDISLGENTTIGTYLRKLQ